MNDPRGRYWSPPMSAFVNEAGRFLAISTLPVAFSSTQAYLPTRCNCVQCVAHDCRLARELRQNELRARDAISRRFNYLEPTIRRLDRAIANLKPFAA